ncbi:MAG: hypothetical protein GY832_26235 [Chloroflexi bacterium]|nr:hypothetical protein [Chloroflexota bacterium]
MARLARLLPGNPAQRTIAALTLLAAVGLGANLAWPSEEYGYRVEQGLLVALGLAALVFFRHNTPAAILFYCSLAHVPILIMTRHHAGQQTSDFDFLLTLPIIGIGVVAAFAQSIRATAFYTAVVLITSCAIGAIYDDAGAAGALCMITVIVGAIGVVWCHGEQCRKDAIEKLHIISRGLDGVQELLQ